MKNWELILEDFGNGFWRDIDDPYSQTYKITIAGKDYREFNRFSWFNAALLDIIETKYVLDYCFDRENNIQKEMLDMYDPRSPFSTNYNQFKT